MQVKLPASGPKNSPATLAYGGAFIQRLPSKAWKKA